MIRGIEKIEFGTPGDGVAGTSLTAFTDFKVSSMNFKDPKYNSENIPAENKPVYITIGGDAEPSTISGELYNVPLDKLPMIAGGTYKSGAKEYYPPTSAPDIYLTVKVTTVATKGKKVEITFPYAKVTAWREGVLTEKELVTVHFEAIANIPVSASGTEGNLSITKIIAA